MKFLSLLMAIAVTALAVACATSPTGRKQLTLLPDEQMSEMGTQAFSQMKQETAIEKSPPVVRYVDCIAGAVAREASDQTDVANWEIVVFKDKQVNAFALPGGKIGVYTGILPVANTANQLAAVLGHEVGHVIARHGNERVSTALAAQGAMDIANTILGERGRTRDIVLAAMGIGAQFGVLLPHSRAQESEADVIGLELMSRAGFDPRESVLLWQNMEKASQGAPPEFMSTHPSNATRISQLREHMPSALALYEKARAAGKSPNCGNLAATK